MKVLLVILIFGSLATAVAQKRTNGRGLPFQVIYAENVKDRKGKEIKQLDLIPNDGALTIGENGFLSMIHHLGFPIEFSGDTTIEIEQINASLTKTKEEFKRRSYYYRDTPDIEYLFLSNAKDARKTKLSATGACHDCYTDLEVIYPPRNPSNLVFYKDDLCVTWQSTGAVKYVIQITNVFDDSLRTYTSATNSLMIPGADLDRIEENEQMILLRITDSSTNKASSAILWELSLDNLDFPYPCSIEKPTQALIAGFYLEMSPRDYTKEAEKYFEMATKLSDKEFYKTMLANFRKRRG